MTSIDQEFFAYLEREDIAGALRLYGELEDRGEAAEVLADACAQLDINDFDELQLALRVADRVIPDGPTSSSAHTAKLACLNRLGRFDEAFAFAHDQRDRPAVLFELYEMSCVHGRLAAAAALAPALREHGFNEVGDNFYNVACKLQGAHSYERALALYEGAILCGSPVPQAHINAGIALLAMGRAAEAAAIARAGLDVAPSDPNLWANLLDALSRGRDLPALATAVDQAASIIGRSSRCDECEHTEAVVECQIGCGALLDDVMGAQLALRKPAAAVDLFSAHASDDSEPHPRLVATFARALAEAGQPERADAILDGGLPTDACTFGFYRARASAAWHRRDRERAVGALAAAVHKDRTAVDVLRDDPAFAAIADHPDLAAGRPIRPPSVPAEAAWDDRDAEWAVGATDVDGAKHGRYRYYRADGTLCNECVFEHGQPHGPFKRFHENGDVSQEGRFDRGQLSGTRLWLACDATTTELIHADGMSRDIRRSEMDYEGGRVVAIRHYDRGGRRCAPDGTPYPDRPAGLPENAFYRSDNDTWRAGEIDADSAQIGAWRTWNSDGVLIEEETFSAGKRHGPYRALFPDGSEAVVGQYEHGSPVGTFTYFRRDGQEHDDFPTSGSRVVRVELIYGTDVPGIRYLDAAGNETTIDGTPRAELPGLHPSLAGWFDALGQIDWPGLKDASGNAHLVPQILIGLLGRDEGDGEEISDHVYSELYWHLCHQGTIYPATAVAVPLLLALLRYERLPHKVALMAFLKNVGCAPRHIVDRAMQEEWEVFLDTYRALMQGVDSFLAMLDDGEPAIRAWATRILGCAYDRDHEASAALIRALDSEPDHKVRGSILFALGRLATADGLALLERELSDDGLVGACAAMALVMARGTEVGERVLDRLIAALSDAEALADDFAQLPWADEHITAELAQALAYGGGGPAVAMKLVDAFDSIDSVSALGLVEAAIRIAMPDDDDMTDELRAVLRGIATSSKPWTFEVNLRQILDQAGLPTTRDQLLALVDG